MIISRISWTIAAIVACAGPVVAKPPAPETPATLRKLTECRAIVENAARLACFDREVATLVTKVDSKELALVDRADVRKTRRSLFGIPLPSIKLFANDDEPEIKEINAVVRTVGRNGDGRLVFTLDEGGTWEQTDDFPLGNAVKPGQKVTLKRGALGSYFADFEKTVPVRARRLR